MPRRKQDDQSISIEIWPTTRPIPYARNPRKISDQAVSSVAGSIKEFGFKSPIIVDGDGVIINGHTRLRAAQQLGLETVPVIVASDLTPAQVQAYRLADNRVAEFTDWDVDLLNIELGELEDFDLDFAKFDELMSKVDAPSFDPGTASDQGQLDKLAPKLVKCPSCGHIHDARENEYAQK